MSRISHYCRSLLIASGLFFILNSVASSALATQAQFPSKPINLVVPYPPGGTNDNVARIISKRLADKAGQPVILIYKGGAGGTIGASYVASSEPDGYTLLNASIGNLAIAPQLIKVKFDPFTDFVPISYSGNAVVTVAINPALPVHTLADLIAYARANPGKLTFASSGNGTPGHMSGEMFKLMTGVDIRHLPYRGSAPAVSDVMAGHADMAFDPLSTVFVKSGKLRALALYGAKDAPTDLQHIPTMAQAGLKDFEDGLAGSFLVAAPSHTPPDILFKLRTWMAEVIQEPEVISALAQVQVIVQPMTPEQITQQIRAVHNVANRVIQTTNLQQD
ncbi:tripartite-type tricarboxylate transporter receptor subunit TctC [Jezberella montanilacus]|uniref:Tripartite-type tricarboxylate transporter receptor subunit TctC n=1 Tax=Jezberella montanilacus TaxID=323426 RepID=A0A2T0XD14_9BURK|nr:tripartite tricarboxylate transporter substrate binding protein [Jezberella montanilacus]PRY96844.1 tripartite-type tricarboxylate transporter receptor subunit TctC [Jezberella montanilacus]